MPLRKCASQNCLTFENRDLSQGCDVEQDDLRSAIRQALPFFKWILETMNPPFDFDKFADASVAYEQLKKAARHGPLVNRNVSAEVKSGKPVKQAVAIAYSVQREAKKKAKNK